MPNSIRSRNDVPLLGQPAHGLGAAPTRDDVEELAGPDIDDLGGEVLAVKGTDPDEEHLVEPERGDLADAVVVSDEQGLAIGDDGVVDGVPVTSELGGHLVDAPGAAADLVGGPPGGAVGHHLAGRGDPVVLLGPTDPSHSHRRGTSIGACATPAGWVGPAAADRPARPLVRSFTWASTPHNRQPTARRPVSTWILAWPPWTVLHTEEKRSSGSPIIHAGTRVGSVIHGGPPFYGRRETSDWWTPAYALADPPTTAPRSFPKYRFVPIDQGHLGG